MKKENEINQLKTYHKQQEEIACVKKTFGSSRLRSFPSIEITFSYSGQLEDYLYQELSPSIDKDFHVTILGANGAGDRYPSSSSHVPYNHEETVSNCAALRLAKCSQHSADQLPYDKSPIEPFQSIFHERWSSKLYFPPRCRNRNTSGASPVYRCMPSVRGSGLSGSRQTSPIKQRLDGLRNWWETDLVN
ncbi:hypothetical protein PISMIDRAFT_17879 [Pisolithus microcarpus 441]|uniref:Uncharacterized protein n=1 Tax=Pisolithus microcarpus 441 TaxID=765257 RepID=A0A0C9Z0R2_9AGAM|nr:hypothetical protein PISMIDRAFT_17879 [Pisolithus microcarpus 441]